MVLMCSTELRMPIIEKKTREIRTFYMVDAAKGLLNRKLLIARVLNFEFSTNFFVASSVKRGLNLAYCHPCPSLSHSPADNMTPDDRSASNGCMTGWLAHSHIRSHSCMRNCSRPNKRECQRCRAPGDRRFVAALRAHRIRRRD